MGRPRKVNSEPAASAPGRPRLRLALVPMRSSYSSWSGCGWPPGGLASEGPIQLVVLARDWPWPHGPSCHGAQALVSGWPGPRWPARGGLLVSSSTFMDRPVSRARRVFPLQFRLYSQTPFLLSSTLRGLQDRFLDGAGPLSPAGLLRVLAAGAAGFSVRRLQGGGLLGLLPSPRRRAAEGWLSKRYLLLQPQRLEWQPLTGGSHPSHHARAFLRGGKVRLQWGST